MSNAINFIFARNYFTYTILGLSIVIIICGYFFRSNISNIINDVVQNSLDFAGVGIILPLIWVCFLCYALIKKEFNFKHIRYFISLILSPVFIIGLLGLISIQNQGNHFYGDFQVISLGGSLGSQISGDNLFLGTIRLVIIFFVLVSIPYPKIILATSFGVWKLLLMVYLSTALLFSSIFNNKSVNSNVAGKKHQRDDEVLLEESHKIIPGSESVDVEALELSDYELNEDIDINELTPNSFSKDFEKRKDESEESNSQHVEGNSVKFDKEFIRKGNTDTKISQNQSVNKIEGNKEKTNTNDEVMEVNEWNLPNTDVLMETSSTGISQQDIDKTSKIIKDTLGEYGIEVEVGQTKPGPAVTMYGLIPGWIRKSRQVKKTDHAGTVVKDELGKPIIEKIENKTRVKVDSIIQREKDLSLALKTPSIRIETPVMGQSLVGIEVPNPSPALVGLRSIMQESQFQKLKSSAKLPIALGKGTGGQSVICDLADMPHLLIAGATGSGKSVCINTIISCLIMEKSPEKMRLIMIDPKRVELTPYNGIPHLLTPVVVDPIEVVDLLKSLINEMLERYKRMESIGARNIETYNQKTTNHMPYIVVTVDELADLMMTASFDVEKSLCRLAQLGRATGIHLIVATQRPSVDVLTGLIKANFPSRISFGVASQIDSRTILDVTGAEKLLGKGDMLYLGADNSRPERVQGVYISDKEVESLVEYWIKCPKGEVGQVILELPDEESDRASALESADANSDPMMEKAIELTKLNTKLSTSLLQRKLRIGYPRAARLMDDLEENGFVAQSDGSKSRDVII